MKVLTLVGPSGTGKSQRAILVAREYGINTMIDDGLLIHEGRLVAGTSAKREDTMMAAVRRAIFEDEDHASEVRQALRALDPDRILVLATSERMVDHIIKELGLPQPWKTVAIEDVASSEEIARARQARKQRGTHVIPAPTFEVQPSFAGYLVNPLRLFRRGKSRRRAEVIEKSVVRPTYSSLGQFYISENVLLEIARAASRETGGVHQVNRASLEIGEGNVSFQLGVTVDYGYNIRRVLEAVRARVHHMVEHMTALNIESIVVRAESLNLDETANESG